MERTIVSSGYDSVCRLCLSMRGETQPIFSTGSGSEDSDPPVLADKIQACVSVEINECDGLPTQICKKCVSNVNNWHIFKRVCNESQVKLRDWVNGEPAPGAVGIKIKKELDESNDEEDMMIDASYPGVELIEQTGEVRLQPEGPPILASLGLAPRNEKGNTDPRADWDRVVAIQSLIDRDEAVEGTESSEENNATQESEVDSDSDQELDSCDEGVDDKQISTSYKSKDGYVKWSKKPSKLVKAEESLKRKYISGCAGSASGVQTPIQAWSCLITDSMVDLIVEHSNEYIEKNYPAAGITGDMNENLTSRNEDSTDHSVEDGSALVETGEVTKVSRRPVAVTQLASKDCLVCGRAYRYSHNARRHELTSHSYDRYTNKVDPAKKPAAKLRPNPYNSTARLIPPTNQKMKLMPNISHKTEASKSHPYPVRIRSMADLRMDNREPEILKSLLTSRPEILVSEPEILRSDSASPENLISEPEFAAFQVETIITEPDTYDDDDDDYDEDGEEEEEEEDGDVSSGENLRVTKHSPAPSAADMDSDCEVEISPNININDIIGVNTNEMNPEYHYGENEEDEHVTGDNEHVAVNNKFEDDENEEDEEDDENDENEDDAESGNEDNKPKDDENTYQESEDGEGYEEELDNDHIDYDDDDDDDDPGVMAPIVEMGEEQTNDTVVEESLLENKTRIKDENVDDESQMMEESQEHDDKSNSHAPVTVTSVQRNFMVKYRDLIEQINTMKCLCCNRDYPRRKAVIQHLQKNGKRVPKHTCYNCVITFGHIGALLSHMRANCCTNVWKLIYEEGGIPDSMIADQSKSRVLPNGQVIEDFYNKAQYKDILNARSYACKICNAKFQLKQIIMKHVLDVHENGGQRIPLICLHCKYMFKDNKLWKKHVRNGECTVHIACDLCPEKFRMLQDFTNHALAVHVGNASNENLNRSVDDRPSACHICNKATANYHNLIKHLKLVHNEEKPHMCQHCDSKFALVTQLNQHIYQEHKQTNVAVNGDIDLSIVKEEVTTYNYSCTECSSLFDTVDGWTEHQITEHHHVAFECDQCSKKFLQDSDLREHKNTHFRIKYYACTLCTNSYSSASKLSEHMGKSHDGATLPENSEDNPFYCEVCMRSFKSRQAFSNHMRIHAKVPTTNRRTVNGETVHSDSPTEIVRVVPPVFNHVKKIDNRIPLTDAPYSCDICGKGFLHKKNIWKHKKMLHADIVSQSGELAARQGNHFMNIPTEESNDYEHTGLSIPQFDSFNTATFEPPVEVVSPVVEDYQCDLCDRKFAVKSSIWKHKRVKHGIVNPNCQEEGSKPDPNRISCTICKISFSDKKAYYRHRKNVHKASVQVCKICGMTLNSTMELYEHLKAAHAKELLGYNASQGTSLKAQGDSNAGTNNASEEEDGQTSGNQSDEQYHARYLCKACGKYFLGMVALQNHSCISGTDPNETFDCEICNKSYTSISALKSHRGWHLRSPDGKAAFSNSGLWMPQNRVTNKTSKFEVPETVIPRVKHSTPYKDIPPLQIKRKLPPDVQLKLLKKKKFSNEVTVELVQTVPRVEPLASLQQISSEDRFCKPCGKQFTKRAAYQRHVEEVHRPNSVFCPICNRSFTRKSTLLVHMRKHETVVNTSGPIDEDDCDEEDGEEDLMKPVYSCDLCNVQYTTAKSLRRHCVRHHNVAAEDIVVERPVPPVKAVETVPRPRSRHRCNQCKQEFASEVELSEHHHYQCNQCNLYFTKTRYLAEHTRRMHSNSHRMLFACDKCDRFYSDKESLQRHVEAAH